MRLKGQLLRRPRTVIGSIVRHEVLNARRVAEELHGHWVVRCKRMSGWLELVQFLVFTAVFCTMLIMQRSAVHGHQVQSAVIQKVGDVERVRNTAHVHQYVQNLVSAVFLDPTCGDGICEGPFEMAAWGRFGCASDCGFLKDEVAIYAIQLDMEWDFSHHPSGVAASTLAAQARWNICPVSVPSHGHECYYDVDQKFRAVMGSSRLQIPALPTGEWALVLKRDYFKKVTAVVRNSRKMEVSGRAFKKIRLALEVASAGMQYERRLTRDALEWASMDLDSIVLWHVNKTAQAIVYEAEAQRGNISKFSDETAYATHLLAIVTNRDAVINNFHNRNIAACRDQLEKLNRLSPVRIADGVTIPQRLAWSLPTTDAHELQSDTSWPHHDQVQTCNGTLCECSRLARIITEAVHDQLEQIHLQLSTRLESTADPDHSGREAVMRSLRRELQLQVLMTEPELFPFTSRLSSGQDAVADPMQSSVKQLADLYFRGSTAYSMGPLALGSADASLDSHNLSLLAPAPSDSISSMDAKVFALATRSHARMSEISETWAATSQRSEVINATKEHPPEYNQVFRIGGTAAFRSCNLEDRSLEIYQGICQKAIQNTTNGTVFCESQVLDCQHQAEVQQGCDALCECSYILNTTHEIVSGCAGHAATAGQSTEFCTCPACSLLSSSRDDVEWAAVSAVSISNRLETNNALQRLSDMRSLKQLPVDSLSSGFKTFLTVQNGLENHVTLADSGVRQVRDAATVRGKAAELENLMSASVSSVHARSTAQHEALAAIIDQQTVISDALERQNLAAVTAQMLAESRDTAIKQIRKGYSEILNALQRAMAQEVVSEEALFALWGAARRRLLLEDKNAIMAATPCTAKGGSVMQYEKIRFTVDHQRASEISPQVRTRTVGAFGNHVLGGVRLHTTRAAPALCSTQYMQLTSICQGTVSTSPFGIDPTFRRTSGDLYQSHLDNEGTKLSLYNCSELPGRPTYNLVYNDRHVGAQTVNEEPYCAELYSQLNEPLAFQAKSFEGFEDGFSVWIDVQNTRLSATELLKHMQGAKFLDVMTQELVVVINSFNPILRVLAQSFVRFSWSTSGMVQSTFNVDTLRARFYNSTSDLVCLAMEFCVFLSFAWGTVSSVRQIKLAGFSEVWRLVLNLGMTCVLCFWWVHTAVHTHQVGMDTSYSVYTNIYSPAHKLKYADAAGIGLAMATESTAQLRKLSSWRNGYFATTGLYVIVLLVLLFVRRMQFHPLLGIVSRSLHLAVEDLENFLFLIACLVGMYAVVGHAVFGASVEKFSTAYLSLETCIHALLGDVSVGKEMRTRLDPDRTIAALYLWSYMILIFTVVLNFMLAIIVDAFIMHKSSGYQHQAGILEEVSTLTKDAVLQMAGKQHMRTAHLGDVLQQCAHPDQYPQDCSFRSFSMQTRKLATSDISQALNRADTYRSRHSQELQHGPHTLKRIAQLVETSTRPSLRI